MTLGASRDAQTWPEPVRPEPREDWPAATDEELAAGFAAGQDGCLEETFRRWAPLVHTVALRQLGDAREAEDVTQQVFVGAWRDHSRYRPEAGRLPAWLLGHTRHRVADRYRSRTRERRLVTAVTQQTTVADHPPAADTVLLRLLLTAELDQLPNPRGTILRMAYYEDQTYAQIAGRLDLPLGTVKSHARRALLQLREQMREVTE